MNIERAKLVPLTTILNRMGAEPVRERTDDIWYKSPIRQENTASFHIKPSKNIWYDHGIGAGGDTITLVCAYLKHSRESNTIVDALRWIRNMTTELPLSPQKYSQKIEENLGWRLRDVKPIQSVGLIRYLEKRKIPVDLATQYLKEVTVTHSTTGSKIFALGFMNEDEGYELRNPFLKSSVAPKAITFVRGETVRPTSLHVFEGIFDFLSASVRFPDLIKLHDSIILNSLSLLERSHAYIRGYGYTTLHSWFDNDEADRRAFLVLQQYCTTEQNLTIRPMNKLYEKHKDINAWHMHNLNLKL
jgi:hypothetical protein